MREPPQSTIKIAQTKTKVKSATAPPSLSPESARLAQYFQRAGVRTESVRRLAQVALTVAGAGGEITERQLRDVTGYALSTVRFGCRRLVGLKVLSPVPKPLGRGYLKTYRVVWGQEHQNPQQTSDFSKSRRTKTVKSLKTQTHSQDPRGQGVGQARERRESGDYQGLEAAKVILVTGSRFFRKVMMQTRLGLESWALPEPIRHALEGFIGLRIDGATLDYARRLVSQIWGLKCEIEALARSGASPKRVCAFIAGRLAGVPDRAKREVLRRTSELVRQTLDSDVIARRIQGLKRFQAEREAEFRAGQVCRRCGYKHTRIEYESGYRADGTGSLSCFGWARVKLDELHEMHKMAERRQRELLCRHCGGALADGHVEGLCWGCWQKLSAYQQPAKFLQTTDLARAEPCKTRDVLLQ